MEGKWYLKHLNSGDLSSKAQPTAIHKMIANTLLTEIASSPWSIIVIEKVSDSDFNVAFQKST